MLPKLVTGMLMVPFTWFIVSATLSVVNILTASVIQLPTATISKIGGPQAAFLTDKIIPKKITFNKDTDYKKDTSVPDMDGDMSVGNGKFLASECPDNCISIEQFLSNGG